MDTFAFIGHNVQTVNTFGTNLSKRKLCLLRKYWSVKIVNCPCTRTLIKACTLIWLPKLSLKENMTDKHLSRQEDFSSKDKLNPFNTLRKLKK